MLRDKLPVFTLTVRDSSGDPRITTIDQDNSGAVWYLLLQLNGNCYCYDWFHSQFELITYQEYSNLRACKHSLEVKANQSRQDTWLELPISTGRPVTLVDNSGVKTKKAYRREPINSHFVSSQSESGLKKYIETERLLDVLSRDDY